MAPLQGMLVLVVGRSGVGKDSLLRYAQDRLRKDSRFVFPRRLITRASDWLSEQHVSIGVGDFERAVESGALALHWQAHGLHYGVPIAIEPALAAGLTVIVNVSRGIIAAARQRYPRCLVVNVTAKPETLAQRLQQRGRESEEAIDARLARRVDLPGTADTVTIDNDGALAPAGDRFVRVLLKTVEPR